MEHAVLSIEPNSSGTVVNELPDAIAQPEEKLQKSASNITRAHQRKPDRAVFPFLDLVDSRFNILVDGAARHTTRANEPVRISGSSMWPWLVKSID